MTEDKMFGWHHQLNGHKPKQTLGDGGQGSLACCGPWSHRVRHDVVTEQQQHTLYQTICLNYNMSPHLEVFIICFQL